MTFPEASLAGGRKRAKAMKIAQPGIASIAINASLFVRPGSIFVMANKKVASLARSVSTPAIPLWRNLADQKV
jgi:hypothetical protein